MQYEAPINNWYALLGCIVPIEKRFKGRVIIKENDYSVDKMLIKMGIPQQKSTEITVIREVTKESLEQMYNVELLSQNQISDLTGYKPSQINTMLKNMGINANEAHLAKHQHKIIDSSIYLDRIKKAYYEEKKGTRKIGKELGIAETTVRKMMIREGLELRHRNGVDNEKR